MSAVSQNLGEARVVTGIATSALVSTSSTNGVGGPLTAVLAQFRAGATSLAEISDRTGLAPDLVRLAVDRLVATGRLSAEQLQSGCPEDACGSCGFARTGGSPCAAGPARARGPVLLRLAEAASVR